MKVQKTTDDQFSYASKVIPQSLWKPHEDNLLTSTNSKAYTVYAIQFWQGLLWFRLSDESQLYPAMLFDVKDNRPSRQWVFSQQVVWIETSKTLSYIAAISHPLFAVGTRNYEALIDGQSEAIAMFARIASEMDREYPDHEQFKTGKILQDSWIMCPNCSEAWIERNSDGVVQCPSCNEMLNNPLWTEHSG